MKSNKSKKSKGQAAAPADTSGNVFNVEDFKRMDNARRREVMLPKLFEEHLKEFPPGSLNLPPLLEARRLEYMLPAGCFDAQCLWDYVMVVQLENSGDSKSQGDIVLPVAHGEARRKTLCTGILVNAGLNALDKLRSNGVDLGHFVVFARHTPWARELDKLGEFPTVGLDLTVTDIRQSLDLELHRRAGNIRFETIDHGDHRRELVYVDENGETWKPEVPELMANYD